jgi:hypothetical protein
MKKILIFNFYLLHLYNKREFSITYSFPVFKFSA